MSGELHSLSHCSTLWTCSKSETSRVARYWGIDESRTGFEDGVGAGGSCLPGVGLSLGDIYATRACVVHDAQPLRHARRFLASGNPQPLGESQPNRLHSVVQLRSRRCYGHTGVAQHDLTRRTGRCGCSRGDRRSLDGARANKSDCGARLAPGPSLASS